MWFTSLTFGVLYGATSFTISYAVSPNGTDWFVYSRNPVLRSGSAGFESRGVSHANVVRVENEYRMYYTGLDQSGGASIALATSTDGIHWTRYSGNPILVNSLGTWESVHVSWPNVYFNGTIYFMFYAGYNGSYSQTGLATSTDGLHWTKNTSNPILQRGNSTAWDANGAIVSSMAVVGTRFYLFYEGGYSPTSVGFATSTDGINWTKYGGNPVFSTGPTGGWDGSQVYRGSVMVKNNVFNYWYSGYSSSYLWQIGFATSPIAPLDVPEPPRELPTDFSLYQAYPNPFNPETTIKYSIPSESRVMIKIFNELGQEVATLANEQKPAGTYTVTWNAVGIASGVYWYRMTAGSFMDTKKIVVLK
jgi:predicted GH43/DUF377 family glycosyl hydrolase